MSVPSEPAWWLILPAKGAPHGKSRLAGSGFDRTLLSRSLALDSIETAAAVVAPERIVLVSDDAVLTGHARAMGARVLPDPGEGLNGAIRHAHAWIRTFAEPDSGAIAVLLADVPAARPGDLRGALAEAATHDRAFVPDRDGTGSVLLTDRTGGLEPSFGPGSAHRHESAGHVRLELALPRLRTDVDVRDDLATVAALGCGRHTREVLGRALRPEVAG